MARLGTGVRPVLVPRNIRLIESEGLRDNVKIPIGGAPVTQEFADEIGADGYAPDGSAAVRVTRKLLGIEAAS